MGRVQTKADAETAGRDRLRGEQPRNFLRLQQFLNGYFDFWGCEKTLRTGGYAGLSEKFTDSTLLLSKSICKEKVREEGEERFQRRKLRRGRSREKIDRPRGGGSAEAEAFVELYHGGGRRAQRKKATAAKGIENPVQPLKARPRDLKALQSKGGGGTEEGMGEEEWL